MQALKLVANRLANVRALPPWAYNSWAGMYTEKMGPKNDNNVMEFESATGTARMRWNPVHTQTPIGFKRWDLAWEEPII